MISTAFKGVSMLSFLTNNKLIISIIILITAGLGLSVQAQNGSQRDIELYVVNFTAEWCPNCRVLDPALYKALETIDRQSVQHIEFDMTTPQRTNETFDKVNGTVLAGVYGDYLGITGLVVMIAADSGEKIDCATRLMSADAIEASITNAVDIVRKKTPGTRETESILCPPANRKIPV